MLVAQGHFSPPVQVAGSLALASPSPAEPAAAVLFETWPAGMSPMGPAETFSVSTLSDKIDGKGELYLSAGFVRLVCQRARVGSGPDSWVEFFAYDMGSPPNSYSVWSSQKRPDASDAGIGDYSYRAENELCVVHGPYYVEVVGADAGDANRAAAESLARAFVAKTHVQAHANLQTEQALFPQGGAGRAGASRLSRPSVWCGEAQVRVRGPLPGRRGRRSRSSWPGARPRLTPTRGG